MNIRNPVHKIAGTSGVYAMKDLSEAARSFENEVLKAANEFPTGTLFNHYKELLDQLRTKVK